MSPKSKAYAALALGVFVVAWAAILIRWAGQDAPPPPVAAAGRFLLGWLQPLGVAGERKAPQLIIAGSRLALAALLLTPIALGRGTLREMRAIGRRGWLLVLLAGTALAVHFAAWISSLAMTTVASSVVLVTTNPLFVGLASHFILRERLSPLTATGIALAVMGSILVGYGDVRLSGEALMGDLLALVGALAASTYFLAGRRLRQRISTLAYIWPVYSLAAVLLGVLCLLAGYSFAGYAPEVYLIFLLLAIGPQLLGHSALNYALGQVSATLVTVAVLGEPIGSAVLAFTLLGEMPPPLALAGGAMTLAGIALAGRGEGRP